MTLTLIYDMDIQEESLIPSRKKLSTLQKRKWFYAVAGFILFLLFTIGISCIFFHLGKMAGCDHTQITNGKTTKPWNQENMKENVTNSTNFTDDRDLCLSNQESEELKELVHEFQYQSQQAYQHLKEAKDEIRKILADKYNRSCEGESTGDGI